MKKELPERNYNWRLLAEKSIACYKDIEDKPDIQFMKRLGLFHLWITFSKDKAGLANAVKSIHLSGYKCDLVDADNMRAKSPHLNFAEDLFGCHQPDHSG